MSQLQYHFIIHPVMFLTLPPFDLNDGIRTNLENLDHSVTGEISEPMIEMEIRRTVGDVRIPPRLTVYHHDTATRFAPGRDPGRSQLLCYLITVCFCLIHLTRTSNQVVALFAGKSPLMGLRGT